MRPGESFTFTIESDASYSTRIVTVNAKRCLDGSATSDTPGWEWKPKTSSVDSLHHAMLSARKALQPRKINKLGTTPMKQPTIGSVFFSSPAAAATPSEAEAAAVTGGGQFPILLGTISYQKT